MTKEATHNILQKDIDNIVRPLDSSWKKLEGKVLLLTGAGGFLGSYFLSTIQHLNRHVLTNPCRVLAFDNFISGSQKDYLDLEHDQHIILQQQDVTKPFRVPEKVNYIIHAAGIASPAYYQQYPLETIDVTVQGTRAMLELAKNQKIQSFLLFSSSEIYGDPSPEYIPTPETCKGFVSCIGPRACYDESKRLAETLCMIYHQLYQVPVKIVRPFNIYGPGMTLNDQRVIPAFMQSALSGKPLRVYDDGSQTRTFCYISDAMTGFWGVLLNGKEREVYNVGNDQEEISMGELAKIFSSLFSPPLKIEYITYPATYPAGETRRRCPHLGKIAKQIGYAPQISLREGLRQTIQWSRASNTNKTH